MMVLVSPSTVKLTIPLLSFTTVQLIVALLVAVQLKEVAVPTNTTLGSEGVTLGRGTVEGELSNRHRVYMLYPQCM